MRLKEAKSRVGSQNPMWGIVLEAVVVEWV